MNIIVIFYLLDQIIYAPFYNIMKSINLTFLYEKRYCYIPLHDAELKTSSGKIICPICKKILKPSEQMCIDHETVCVLCGTVLHEDESVSSLEIPESCANLSINLVGNYQKLLPMEIKSNLSSLKRFYINRPDLSTFATICQWLELPTYVSQEAWILYKKISAAKKCVKADAALFALMRSCQRHSIPRTETKISHYVRCEMGRKHIRSYAKICSDLKPLLQNSHLDSDYGTLNYYLNLHFKTLGKKYPHIDIAKIRVMVQQKLDVDGFVSNKDTSVKKAIKFVMGGLYT
ncbi:MAG: hypothetical protein K8823_46 [Cenarchaeum symbiont of Oopsacas minuta]|nr:hypothetical protein [Cenarchaeum symbiont of Oopsacas minuta]